MAFISLAKKTNIIKKQIGTDNGNPVYRNMMEIYCQRCGNTFTCKLTSVVECSKCDNKVENEK